MISTFTGALNGTSYTDPALFALDAKAAGVARSLPSGKPDRGRTPAQMTALTALEKEWLGMFVTHHFGGSGQVWCIGGPGIVAVIFEGTREATWRKTSELTKVASIRLRAEQDGLL